MFQINAFCAFWKFRIAEKPPFRERAASYRCKPSWRHVWLAAPSPILLCPIETHSYFPSHLNELLTCIYKATSVLPDPLSQVSGCSVMNTYYTLLQRSNKAKQTKTKLFQKWSTNMSLFNSTEKSSLMIWSSDMILLNSSPRGTWLARFQGF